MKLRIALLSYFLPLFAAAVTPADISGWKAGREVAPSELASYEAVAFTVNPIDSEVAARIKGKSLPVKSPGITMADLCYIPLLHRDAEGRILTGELIVNRAIADDIADIFRRLYAIAYPIESIRLIDEFEAKDEPSMRANNSSAFCYRTVAGSKRLSKHALGMAIDINPLYNPYFKIVRNERGDSIGYRHLQPSTATPYIDRSAAFPYKMDATDPAVRLFKEHGFIWGGDWPNTKDYQHFEHP